MKLPEKTNNMEEIKMNVLEKPDTRILWMSPSDAVKNLSIHHACHLST